MMVGREVRLELEKKPHQVGDRVLEVSDLVVMDERHQIAVDEVSFDVCAGEVLGIAGVQGNGQTELVEALTGLRQPAEGTITVLGERPLPIHHARSLSSAPHMSPKTAKEMGWCSLSRLLTI
jgi:general nucleoside transport system ATP-binding protein